MSTASAMAIARPQPEAGQRPVERDAALPGEERGVFRQAAAQSPKGAGTR